jgi:deazaflavin-dependent oxidoreductase (nitroreductase family)
VLINVFWRLINPILRPLAGLAPWWILVETTGRRTGKTRRTPLAAGPREDHGMLVIAVHGRHAGWVVNAEANPEVRVRHRGRWRHAHAELMPWDAGVARRFNVYARSGPALAAHDPLIVRLDYLDAR